MNSGAGVYYMVDNTDVVQIVDIATHAITRSITANGVPNLTVYDSGNGHLYVSAQSGHRVWVVDPTTGASLAMLSGVPQCEDVDGLEVDPVTNHVYTLSNNNGSTSPAQLLDLSVTTVLPT